MAKKKEIVATSSEIIKAIDEVVLSERDRHIMKRRLIDKTLFSELEEEFFLSERQIKRIVYRNFEKIVMFLNKST